jgi:hypothetical protein
MPPSTPGIDRRQASIPGSRQCRKRGRSTAPECQRRCRGRGPKNGGIRINAENVVAVPRPSVSVDAGQRLQGRAAFESWRWCSCPDRNVGSDGVGEVHEVRPEKRYDALQRPNDTEQGRPASEEQGDPGLRRGAPGEAVRTACGSSSTAARSPDKAHRLPMAESGTGSGGHWSALTWTPDRPESRRPEPFKAGRGAPPPFERQVRRTGTALKVMPASARRRIAVAPCADAPMR